MLCPSCGAEVLETANYCHQCAARLPGAPPGFAAQAFSADVPAGGPPPEAASPAEDVAVRAARAIGNRGAHRAGPEVEAWSGGYSAKAMIGNWLLSGLATIVMLVAGILLSVVPTAWLAMGVAIAVLWIWQGLTYLVRRYGTRYLLTNQRFVHERGILARTTNRIEVIDIDDITVEQGPVERMVGVGRIRISSSDRTDPELIMTGIDNVREVASLMDNIRREERMRRSVHIEAV